MHLFTNCSISNYERCCLLYIWDWLYAAVEEEKTQILVTIIAWCTLEPYILINQVFAVYFNKGRITSLCIYNIFCLHECLIFFIIVLFAFVPKFMGITITHFIKSYIINIIICKGTIIISLPLLQFNNIFCIFIQIHGQTFDLDTTRYFQDITTEICDTSLMYLLMWALLNFLGINNIYSQTLNL